MHIRDPLINPTHLLVKGPDLLVQAIASKQQLADLGLQGIVAAL
jgi:hypothetical protein